MTLCDGNSSPWFECHRLRMGGVVLPYSYLVSLAIEVRSLNVFRVYPTPSDTVGDVIERVLCKRADAETTVSVLFLTNSVSEDNKEN